MAKLRNDLVDRIQSTGPARLPSNLPLLLPRRVNLRIRLDLGDCPLSA